MGIVLRALAACLIVTATAHAATNDRLIDLCRLWGYVKVFHPAVETDWDRALVEAIPATMAAQTRDEEIAALQAMLSKLGDPLTRIAEPIAPVDAPPFAHAMSGEGILVITARDYFGLFAASGEIGKAAAEVAMARAVVLDLRGTVPLEPFSASQLRAALAPIERALFGTPLATAAERRRLHHGYPGESFASSGQFRSGFFTRDGKQLQPAAGARDVPVVFVLNEQSGLLDSIVRLQARGTARIVVEGKRPPAAGSTTTLALSDGIVAEVRVMERLFADHSSADVHPDAIVEGNALATALAFARDFKSSTVVRPILLAAAAPPRENAYPTMTYPPVEYRLLAAFRLWNVIEHFYPHKPEDWTETLRRMLPAFLAASNAREYALAVAEMAAALDDSHTYVAGTVFTDQIIGAGYAPVTLALIDGQFVITAVKDPAVALRPGDVITAIDGEDPRVRYERMARYVSASTPQSKRYKTLAVLLNGPPDTPVTLRVGDREVRVPRRREDFTTLYHRERTGEIVKLLPGNIGYVDLDRLTFPMIDSMFEQLKDTRAIIFDMRGYPLDTVWFIAPRLTDEPVRAALLETPLVGFEAEEEAAAALFQMIRPAAPDRIYRGQTVMLMDERSQSQAEHTGLYLRAANGTRFIGSATAGADGELDTVVLPGRITVGFTGQSVHHPDGRPLQRVGLLPDIEVKPTLAGIRAERDEVLEHAIRSLTPQP